MTHATFMASGQARTVQWERAAPGSCQRGVVWVRSPRVVAAMIVFVVLLTIVGAIRQKKRRRRPETNREGADSRSPH